MTPQLVCLTNGTEHRIAIFTTLPRQVSLTSLAVNGTRTDATYNDQLELLFQVNALLASGYWIIAAAPLPVTPAP